MISSNRPSHQPATFHASTNNSMPHVQSHYPTSFNPSSLPTQANQHYLPNTTNSSVHGHPPFDPYYHHNSQPYHHHYYRVPTDQVTSDPYYSYDSQSYHYGYSHFAQTSYPYPHPTMSHSAHPSTSFESATPFFSSSNNNLYSNHPLPPIVQPPHRDYSSYSHADPHSSLSGPDIDTAHQVYSFSAPSTSFQPNSAPTPSYPCSVPMHNETGFAAYSAPAFNPHVPYPTSVRSEPYRPPLYQPSMHYIESAQPQAHPYHQQPQQPLADPSSMRDTQANQPLVSHSKDHLLQINSNQVYKPHLPHLPHPQRSPPHKLGLQPREPQKLRAKKLEVQKANKQIEEEKRQESERAKDTIQVQLRRRDLAIRAAASSNGVQRTSSRQQDKNCADSTRTLELRASRVNDTNTKNEVTQAEIDTLGPTERGKVGGFLLRMSYQMLRAYYVREKKNMANERRHFVFSYADMLRAYDGLGDYFLDVANQRCVELAAEARIPNLRDATIVKLEDETEEEVEGKREVKLKYQEAVEKLQSNQMPAKRRGNLPKEGIEYLKKWFYDHYDYPYPTDEEKEEISKEANITVFQLSHWFINYRKRVWKPNLPSDHPLQATEGTKVSRKRTRQNGNGIDDEGGQAAMPFNEFGQRD